MLYAQRMIDFETPVNAEAAHVAEQTSEPPPADQARQAPPLVRPDRQLTYDGTPHYEWPDPKSIHDRDTITVDRIREDIDGPSHRFIIKRFDQVEVYFSVEKTETGEVVGVSVLKSSGDQAFDRSAINAVNKAARFPEVAEAPPQVFERRLRSLQLVFRPEDLRQ